MGKVGRFGNELGEVIEWQDEDFSSLAWCNVGDLPKLKALRTQFKPAHLLNSETIDHSPSVSGYLDTLQALSHSRWSLYEIRSLAKSESFTILRKVYDPLVRDIPWKDICVSNSIQVIGPSECGTSDLMKIICEETRQKWPVVLLENFMSPSEKPLPTLYGIASLVSGRTQSKPHTIFVKAEYGQHKRQFAKEWSEELLDHIAGPLTFKDSLRHSLESLIARTQLFDGSIATLSSYIEKVFSSITLNTTDAITSALEESPRTVEQLYKREILTLRAKPLVQAWAASAVSWVLWSVRPLQVEELATVVAINLDDSDINSHETRPSDASQCLCPNGKPVYVYMQRNNEALSFKE
ncbi:hypothetical protein BDV39DRAFT_203097 [Aspergillus sergii]|uniref:Uncharacterized protein n=1 Tax=Aspergillus sergii TaxID=1034303 RepID=A0A5N6X8B7_9EURO|nr:hypothetical protein BDV39DRAFT_203097 [Aspergillus sergii]